MSDFYFRGQNVLDRISPDEADSGLIRNGMDATYFFGKNAIKLSAAQIYSLSQQLPNGDSAQYSGPSNPDFEDLQDFRRAPRDRYSELNFSLGYSREFLNGVFAPDQAFLGTVGLSHYRFSNSQFWNSGDGGIDHTSEWMARLAYIGMGRQGGSFSWNITPSVEWNHDFDAFPGDFLQFNLDGEFTIAPWKLRIAPHVGVGYDMKYTGENNDWNHIEASVTLSRPLTQNLALNLIGGYNWSLDGGSDDRERRADDGFFGAVSLSLNLGAYTATAPESASGNAGKNIVIDTPDRNRWSLSAGAGYRELDASFSSKPIKAYDALGLVRRQPGGGKDGFADASGADYLNGSIGGPNPGIPGTSGFVGGERLGSAATADRQALFRSQRFAYRQESSTQSQGEEDSDEILSPYVKLSYDLVDHAHWALGFGLQYAFSDADAFSGLSPVTLSHGFERVTNKGFIYDFDERLSGGQEFLITDPDAYADYLAGIFSDPDLAEGQRSRRPQSTDEVIENEVVRVAGFLESSLSVRLHEITVPLSVTFKPSRRYEISLAVGPTLNLFDTELSSELNFQELPNLEGGRVLSRNLSFERRSELFSDGTSQSASGTAAASAADAPAQRPGARPAPGKGSLNTSYPRLPGRTVATRRSVEDDQHFSWGVMGQGTLTIYLDDAQKWFFDVWGRYNYVSPFTVSNDLTSAEVDASSWSAGAGLGFRF